MIMKIILALKMFYKIVLQKWSLWKWQVATKIVEFPDLKYVLYILRHWLLS